MNAVMEAAMMEAAMQEKVRPAEAGTGPGGAPGSAAERAVLRRVKFKRLACFTGGVDFTLRPLTFVMGRTGSGKSTLLRGVMMLLAALGRHRCDVWGAGLFGRSFLECFERNDGAGPPEMEVSAEFAQGGKDVSLQWSCGETPDPDRQHLLKGWWMAYDAPGDGAGATYETQTDRELCIDVGGGETGMLPDLSRVERTPGVAGVLEGVREAAEGMRYMPAGYAGFEDRNPGQPQPPETPGERGTNAWCVGPKGHAADVLALKLAKFADEALGIELGAESGCGRSAGEMVAEKSGRAGDGLMLAATCLRDGVRLAANAPPGSLAGTRAIATAIALLDTREPGVDLIEHPGEGLDGPATALLARLLTGSIGERRNRPLVVESHSEILALEIRRAIVAGEIDPGDVAVYRVRDARDPKDFAPSVKTPVLELQGNPEHDAAWDGSPGEVSETGYEAVLALARAKRRRDEANAVAKAEAGGAAS